MATATLGLFVLKLTLTTVIGLFVLLAAARASAAIRHRIVVATFVALAALPVAAAVLPPVVVPVLRDLLPMAASAGEPTTSQDAPEFATSHDRSPQRSRCGSSRGPSRRVDFTPGPVVSKAGASICTRSLRRCPLPSGSWSSSMDWRGIDSISS
jgi:hypothetical protein